MNEMLARDIDYLIEKKENYIEKLKKEGKSTEAVEIEIEILQKARDMILDCILLSQEFQKKFSELEQKERENKIKIERGEAVEAAFILICLNQKEYAALLGDVLTQIVYYPKTVIAKLKIYEDCLSDTEKQLEFIQKKYKYTNESARKVYKELCEFAGIDYRKKATAWKNNSKVREKIEKGDTRTPEMIKTAVLQDNIIQYIDKK